MEKKRTSYFVLGLALLLSLTLIVQTDSFAKTRVQKVVYDVAGNNTYFEAEKVITIDHQSAGKCLPKPSPKVWKLSNDLSVDSAVYPIILKLIRPFKLIDLSVD